MHQYSIGMATLFQAQHLDDLSLTFQGKSVAQQNQFYCSLLIMSYIELYEL